MADAFFGKLVPIYGQSTPISVGPMFFVKLKDAYKLAKYGQIHFIERGSAARIVAQAEPLRMNVEIIIVHEDPSDGKVAVERKVMTRGESLAVGESLIHQFCDGVKRARVAVSGWAGWMKHTDRESGKSVTAKAFPLRLVTLEGQQA